MKVALITLSPEGLAVARAVAGELQECDLFVHHQVHQVPPPTGAGWTGFDRVTELTKEIFHRYRGLVYVMPSGVVVRAIAPCLNHKTRDPAVVAVDVGHRYAVSLCSGHEGGANDLAIAVSNAIGAEPVISTTTEAVKGLIAGVGCRRGVSASQVIAALRNGLALADRRLDEVRLVASVEIKKNETGLLAAAAELGLPLRFIAAEEIRRHEPRWQTSVLVRERVNLPAVAEPCALLAGRRTQLILPKTIVDQVTVALAQESCMWSASAPVTPPTEPSGP
jgi:cobalt-precorrin 5A hydrolase